MERIICCLNCEFKFNMAPHVGLTPSAVGTKWGQVQQRNEFKNLLSPLSSDEEQSVTNDKKAKEKRNGKHSKPWPKRRKRNGL